MKSKNHLAVIQLELLGYEMPGIRQSLHYLNKITQVGIARKLGVSRILVTQVVAGRRMNNEIRDALSEIWDIPVDVLFKDRLFQKKRGKCAKKSKDR